ncbi:flavin reductase family protein [Xanthobacter autotrophicus]|uniref:Flavin reductase family protein n=1 Tax=Xanthobacter autotrophicus TaxID=280 RepID=A0A6C1KC53_XANAU|nr:flavin reductase family protein [Xanthobacter autotrophicus]TLX41381.1 flavin reductase family protein [Xanthobacter autotrophicus]
MTKTTIQPSDPSDDKIHDPGFDPSSFRKALGSFATGVCVVTARSGDGNAIGVTCSSFNSVSLDPPLVLWSLAKRAFSLPVFQAAEHWAINILSSEQEHFSNRFARSGEDKFDDVATELGIGNVPLLRDCCARFQCKHEHRYDGGDHVILVGRVLQFDRSDRQPLVFHSGQYSRLLRAV